MSPRTVLVLTHPVRPEALEASAAVLGLLRSAGLRPLLLTAEAAVIPGCEGVERVSDEAARAARVVVPDYQLSLAIGREGQNARLAARLTGWRIDIRSDTEKPEA